MKKDSHRNFRSQLSQHNHTLREIFLAFFSSIGRAFLIRGFLCKSILVCLSLLLSSCFFVKQSPDTEALSKTAQDHLRAREYQKALEIYQRAWDQDHDNTRLGNEYLHAIENVKKNADHAFEKKDFSSAGYLYYALLQYYPDNRALVRLLSFSKDELSLSVKNCSKHLNMRGLEEYRSGNLKAAIATWKSILLFDGNNVEVKKAIQTASTQLKNLEKNF